MILRKDHNIASKPTLEEAKEYIYSLDFSLIIGKLVKYQGWLQKCAEETCELYRNFLYLNKKYKGVYDIPPSKDVDEFWHSHILDTEKYMKDCEAIFGSYFHHYPYFGIDDISNMNDLMNAFNIAQKLHIEEFKKPVPPTKSKYPKALYYLMKKFSILGLSV